MGFPLVSYMNLDLSFIFEYLKQAISWPDTAWMSINTTQGHRVYTMSQDRQCPYMLCCLCNRLKGIQEHSALIF